MCVCVFRCKHSLPRIAEPPEPPLPEPLVEVSSHTVSVPPKFASAEVTKKTRHNSPQSLSLRYHTTHKLTFENAGVYFEHKDARYIDVGQELYVDDSWCARLSNPQCLLRKVHPNLCLISIDSIHSTIIISCGPVDAPLWVEVDDQSVCSSRVVEYVSLKCVQLREGEREREREKERGVSEGECV